MQKITCLVLTLAPHSNKTGPLASECVCVAVVTVSLRRSIWCAQGSERGVLKTQKGNENTTNQKIVLICIFIAKKTRAKAPQPGYTQHVIGLDSDFLTSTVRASLMRTISPIGADILVCACRWRHGTDGLGDSASFFLWWSFHVRRQGWTFYVAFSRRKQ